MFFLKIVLSNEITIHEPIKEVQEHCKKELIVRNPDYDKKERLGLWLGDTPQHLQLYRTNAGSIVCPVGAMKGICDVLKECGYEKSNIFHLDYGEQKEIFYNAGIELYDYQQDALRAMRTVGYGILQSPAGSGKTQIGIALAASFGLKTLWLTHTKDLLTQSYERAARYISEDLLGTITAGKVDIGKGITFATVQTLSKQDLNAYKYEWDVVIVDECHRVAGTPASATQFSKVLNALAAMYKFGLSATVHRADGLIKATYALLGDVKYTVPDSAVKDKVMKVNVKPVHTGCKDIPPEALDTDGTIIYSKFISEIAKNERRNKVILDNLLLNADNYNLILSDRLEQLHGLYDALPPELQEKAAVIDGKMTSKKGKEQRKQAIEDMREGKKHFLFASYKLAKEGLDIPRLDRLHLATPQKDYAVIVQSVGRIARTFEGKGQPICLDYLDDIGMMQGFYKKRCTSYRKCGCYVCK